MLFSKRPHSHTFKHTWLTLSKRSKPLLRQMATVMTVRGRYPDTASKSKMSKDQSLSPWRSISRHSGVRLCPWGISRCRDMGGGGGMVLVVAIHKCAAFPLVHSVFSFPHPTSKPSSPRSPFFPCIDNPSLYHIPSPSLLSSSISIHACPLPPCLPAGRGNAALEAERVAAEQCLAACRRECR